MPTDERDPRVRLLNTLLTTPHRDLARIYPVHQEIITQDPRFYVHMASWYADEGEVRDHKEMFVVNLVLSDFPGHRDVGLALLRQMPPYQVGRVFDFVKGQVLRRRVRRSGTADVVTERRGLLHRSVRRQVEGAETLEIVTEKRGLFRNVPRSMKTEITRYLREREADPDWFDSTALHARGAIKRLYASLHIAPSPRAQAILFDDNPPPDSRLYALKRIRRARTPAEKARAIVENRIPYRVAASVIERMTPTVLVALIDRMSPQELINNLGSLKRHGVFDNADVKALIDGKLVEAESAGRVSAYKAKVAAEAVGATGELAESLDRVTETQVKAMGTISRPTALLIDKSGSMDVAIEVGRQLGALVSAICEADLFVYAYDTVAYPIQPQGTTLADWEKALLGIHAGGATSCGVALEWMRRQGQQVEQIVMITDELENRAPRFQDAYLAYREAIGVSPAVILIKVGQAGEVLEIACAQLGIPPNVFEFRGDYYALPNVIPLLTRPSMMELVMEVLSYPLPERKAQ